MPAAFPYKDKLKKWLAQSYLKEIAESLISTVQEDSDPGAASLRKESFNLLGRLNAAQKERDGGRLSHQDFALEENQIRASLSSMIDDLEPEWVQAPKPTHNAVNPPRDSLDQVFKSLLLALSLLAIGLAIYTMFFHHNGEEKLPLIALSVVGGSGAFYGYGRWRVIELQYLNRAL